MVNKDSDTSGDELPESFPKLPVKSMEGFVILENLLEKEENKKTLVSVTAIPLAYYKNVMHFSAYRGIAIECDV